jgi:hypothetical protein
MTAMANAFQYTRYGACLEVGRKEDYEGSIRRVSGLRGISNHSALTECIFLKTCGDIMIGMEWEELLPSCPLPPLGLHPGRKFTVTIGTRKTSLSLNEIISVERLIQYSVITTTHERPIHHSDHLQAKNFFFYSLGVG